MWQSSFIGLQCICNIFRQVTWESIPTVFDDTKYRWNWFPGYLMASSDVGIGSQGI